MKKIIKIGFPIVCVAVIGGTFVLLNRTTDRINRNRLKDDDEPKTVVESTTSSNENTVIDENVTLDPEEAKVQEVKNKAKAIELVKNITTKYTDCYYTNEGMDGTNYLVAIKDNKTKETKIYYSVDIQNEKVEIYEK